MPGQLSLNLISFNTYQSDNFLIHHGLDPIFEQILAGFAYPDFQRFLIFGGKRAGKTHLACKFSKLALDLNLHSRILSAKELIQDFTIYGLPEFDAKSVLIIDDAAEIFNEEYKGIFVAIYEQLRIVGAKLIMLSDPLDLDHFDLSVVSRLKSCGTYEILPPSEQDLFALIQIMAKQRGILLSNRSLDYLARRVQRNILGIELILERLLDHAKRLNQTISYSMLSSLF